MTTRRSFIAAILSTVAAFYVPMMPWVVEPPPEWEAFVVNEGLDPGITIASVTRSGRRVFYHMEPRQPGELASMLQVRLDGQGTPVACRMSSGGEWRPFAGEPNA